MADYRAIEGASRTLRSLLRDRMQEPVPVTLLPPDVEPADIDEPRINLYLFEIRQHAQLRNQMPPGEGPPGAFGKPPLSLELLYLLTTIVPTETAIEADLGCQRMLGDALAVLNEWPVVTRRLLAVTSRDRPAGAPILDTALLDEHEALKATLHPAGLEEYTKIWTALPEAAFRRAVILAVSVVQISARVPPASPRPVLKRRLVADLGRRPVIDSVAEPRVVLGGTIAIHGRNLAGQRTMVRLGGLDPIEVLPDGAGERLEIALPDDIYPAAAVPPGPRPIPTDRRLRAGTLTVQVIVEHGRESIEGGRDDPGTPGTATARLLSDLGVLQLLPELAGVSPASATLAAAGAPGAMLTLTGRRLFSPGASTTVLIGDHAFDGQRFVADPMQDWLPPPDDRVAVPLRRIAAALPPPPAGGATYAVQAIVDGARTAPGPAVTFRLDP
ncbi:MAG TPA: Pvc16 family protein [Geminicoccaceae bacterium]|nr:Pvc16 family protein [Geminicoccus sp.]HMU50438.1 Pvc16 family protein [Geminicoccaceae bacterium]